MTTPEAALLAKLVGALDAVLVGADDAARIMGPLPSSVAEFATFDALRRTAPPRHA